MKRTVFTALTAAMITFTAASQVILYDSIFFETGKSDLKNESRAELSKLIGFLENNPELTIEISGHTDNVGTEEFNQKLSEDRAKAVLDYLVEGKIKASRLVYKGYGFLHPIQSNETGEGRAQNRRTEIKILEIEKSN